MLENEMDTEIGTPENFKKISENFSTYAPVPWKQTRIKTRICRGANAVYGDLHIFTPHDD
jgi:hypothetical protein